jgi:hypothetical protein
MFLALNRSSDSHARSSATGNTFDHNGFPMALDPKFGFQLNKEQMPLALA